MTEQTGWAAVVLIVCAALFPVLYRLRSRKRAAPDSNFTKLHVALGTAAFAIAFLHTLAIVPDLGSPAAVGGGMIAFIPGGIAFFLLISHAGIGLQLRNVRLRDRVRKRRMHVVTATAIGVFVALHVMLLARTGY